MAAQVQSRHAQSQAVGKVAIIGGGVAGIAAARVFIAEGADVSLFEKRTRFGGVWAQNYAGYGVQTPAALYEFPDEPFTGADFPKGEDINDYIVGYAKKHGVAKIAQLGTEITRMEQVNGTTQWQLDIQQNGGQRTATFDLVIMATGVYSDWKKNVPDVPGADSFAGKMVHSVDFSEDMLQECAGKNVVTVGYGKSAFDCARSTSKTAAKSALVFREAHWPVPRKILGLIPFEYATFNRMGHALLLPGYPNPGPIEWLLHKIPGFLTFLWWLISRIFKFQFGLGKTPSTVPEKSFIADFWTSAGVIPHPDFFPCVHQGKINAVKGQVASLKQNSVQLVDGQEIPCDVLIWGTGYKQELHPLAPAALKAKVEADGLWLYRQMIHPEFPTLVFLNSQVTTFTNITTPSLQSRWLHEMITRDLLPTDKAMYAAIREKQEWKRATTPQSRSRATMVQTHQVHYYDELLKDMGASIRRKRGPFASLKEFADPYRPRDYDSIVTGEFKTRPHECATPSKPQRSFLQEAFVVVLQLSLVVMAVRATLNSW